MSKIIDLKGIRFGKLLVTERVENNKAGNAMWKCLCDCGNTCTYAGARLRSGHNKSCGCLKNTPRYIDEIGNTYGKLRVISFSHTDKKDSFWNCKCECGNNTVCKGTELRSGNVKSCGCLKEHRYIDEIGNIYGRLTVLKLSHTDKQNAFWNCKCECGNEKIINGTSLRSGATQSCGCLQKEVASEVGKSKAELIDISTRFGKLVVLSRAEQPRWHIKKRTYWNVICDCGNTKIVAGDHLRRGLVKSCGCVKSRGQEEISKILSDNKIDYKIEYSFSDLKSLKNSSLRFDFAIFNNGVLSHLIEYDGIQHSDSSSKFYSDTILLHDTLKTKYCIKNNIRLIRISKIKDIKLENLL